MADAEKPVDVFPILGILLMLVGVIGLFSGAFPRAVSLGCAFVGGAIHFIHSIRVGEITTRFLFLTWPRTIDREQSPTLFLFVAIFEGLWVVAFFFGFLFSL
jgi:hypothetical protein